MKQNEAGWVEYVHGVQLTKVCSSVVLHRIAEGIANAAMRMLAHKKSLRTTAFVFAESVCEMLYLRFQSSEEQLEAYKKLGLYCNGVEAHSTIIVQDTYIHLDTAIKRYGKTDALMTLVVSKRTRDYVLVQPYYRHMVSHKEGKEVLFFMNRVNEGPKLAKAMGDWWA